MSEAKPASAMAWYAPEDYPRLLEIVDDPEQFPPDWQAWREQAEIGKRQLERQGLVVIPAIIDPEELLAWARTRGLNVDAKARMTVAMEIVRLLIEEKDRD